MATIGLLQKRHIGIKTITKNVGAQRLNYFARETLHLQHTLQAEPLTNVMFIRK